MHFFFFFVYSV